MSKSLSIAILAPVPVDTSGTREEPLSNARLLFLIGAGVVIALLLAILASRMLRKKR